tara:strand:- start:1222 stop:2091 length:870 start_codon:yes stop_codon:yes gene_type:complete
MSAKDPIDIMNELKSQNSFLNDSTLDLNSKNQENNVNNEILVKQDQLMKIKNDELNHQLDKLKDMENNIINKDRIIEQTDKHIEKNDKNIFILYISLALSIIIFLSIILYAFGQVNDRILNIIIITIILIFLIILLYTYNIFHFASIVNFIDNRRNLRLQDSISNFERKFGLQQRLYGNKQDYVDENCDCPETEDVFTDEENIGVDIKPGYFYYDKNAPKQVLVPHGGEKTNVADDTTNKIYNKINWVNHDKKTYDEDYDTKPYKIEPNKNYLYKDGNLVNDSTYSINL